MVDIPAVCENEAQKYEISGEIGNTHTFFYAHARKKPLRD